jgi:hypothetical protein
MGKRAEISETEWDLLSKKVLEQIYEIESVEKSAIEMRLSIGTVRKFVNGQLKPTWLTKLKFEKWLLKRGENIINRENYNE